MGNLGKGKLAVWEEGEGGASAARSFDSASLRSELESQLLGGKNRGWFQTSLYGLRTCMTGEGQGWVPASARTTATEVEGCVIQSALGGELGKIWGDEA